MGGADVGSLADQPTSEPGPSDTPLVANIAVGTPSGHVEGGDGSTKRKRGRPRKQGMEGKVSVLKFFSCFKGWTECSVLLLCKCLVACVVCVCVCVCVCALVQFLPHFN